MTQRQLILGTAGHIDHGKTALIRALTGIDTDRLDEEQTRGISIDIGFAHFDLDGRQIGVVDVPGHERFIKNMLAGACGVDIAVLVIAADDSVMPQTREHLEILKLLRIRRGLVAITKTDLADGDWQDLVEEDIRELVRGSFLEDAPVVRVSSVTGEGLDALRQTLTAIADDVPPPEATTLARLSVDRAFMLPGRGTIVTGTVMSGGMTVGSELDWLPVGRTVRIRGMQSHGTARESVNAGERVALDITGAHHGEIRRGHVLATPGYLAPSTRLTVQLRVLDDSPWPIRHRGRLRVYLGTEEVMAQVVLLEDTTLEPGASAPAQLVCAAPVATAGRQPFVVRAESPLHTIGGGIVLQTGAQRIRRRDTTAIARLAGHDVEDETERVATAAYFLDQRPIDKHVIAREAAVDLDRAATLVQQLRDADALVSLATRHRETRLLHCDRLDELAVHVVRGLERLHAAAPLQMQVPRDRLASRLGYIDRVVLDGVLQHMMDTGALLGGVQGIALPSFTPVLSAAQQRLYAGVIEAYASAGFRPPLADELATALGVSVDEVRPLIQLGVEQGEVIALGQEFFLHRQWEEELRRRITASLAAPGLTMSEIKEVLETSRKFAVPMCEYLDRIGLTVRRADRRVLAETVRS